MSTPYIGKHAQLNKFGSVITSFSLRGAATHLTATSSVPGLCRRVLTRVDLILFLEMSETRPRSLSRHETPASSRPGTPSSLRRPSIRSHNSVPSLALANAQLLASASPAQVSNEQAVTIEQSGVLSSNASISESSHGGIIISSSHYGSTEQVYLAEESSGSNGATPHLMRSPEEVTADAGKLREQLKKSLSRGRGE